MHNYIKVVNFMKKTILINLRIQLLYIAPINSSATIILIIIDPIIVIIIILLLLLLLLLRVHYFITVIFRGS